MTGNLDHLRNGATPLCPTAVPEERLVGWRVDGFWLVLGRVGTDLYAYREICADCGSSLVEAAVDRGLVTCTVCGQRYDLQRGGRRVDMSGRGIEPIPVIGEAPSRVTTSAT